MHVQNSVFEGELTTGARTNLESELETLLDEGESIIMYEVSSEKWMDRTVFGEDPAEDSQFL